VRVREKGTGREKGERKRYFKGREGERDLRRDLDMKKTKI